jgi:hypothetical protein
MNDLELSVSRGGTIRSGAALLAILVIDVGLLGFAAYVLLSELETQVLPFFHREPAVAARPVAMNKTARLPTKQKARVAASAAVTGEGEVFGRYGGTCDAEYDGDGVRLTYSVESPSSAAGYTVPLKAGHYAHIAFRIKGETGDEVFSVIADGEGAGTEKIAISQVCPSREPGKWQEILIPLQKLIPEQSGADIRGFSIVFENNQGMPYSGTLCLDNIRLTE